MHSSQSFSDSVGDRGALRPRGPDDLSRAGAPPSEPRRSAPPVASAADHIQAHAPSDPQHYGASVDLTGTWRAAAADEALRRSFHHVGFDDDGWEPVRIPGHWADVATFSDERSMLFRHRFEHRLPADDGGRSWLELDGICYQGDVWLDGRYLGDTEGYFVRHAFDVTGALRDREDHELAIEVNCSPSGSGHKRRSILGIYEGDNDMVTTRNPGGIWAPLRLRHTGPVRIHGVRAICETADEHRAVVAVRAMLATASARSVRVITEIGGVVHEADHSIAVGLNEVEWRVTVPRPRAVVAVSVGRPATVRAGRAGGDENKRGERSARSADRAAFHRCQALAIHRQR